MKWAVPSRAPREKAQVPVSSSLIPFLLIPSSVGSPELRGDVLNMMKNCSQSIEKCAIATIETDGESASALVPAASVSAVATVAASVGERDHCSQNLTRRTSC